MWSTATQMWHCVLEREVIERRQLEEEALLDRRRDCNRPKRTKKGPGPPSESERTAHRITHLPPAPWWTLAHWNVASKHLT